MTTSYPIKNQIRCSATFYDSSGIEADPTTIRALIRKPDNNRVSYVYGTDIELIKDATGKYHFLLYLSQFGKWSYRFEGTGDVIAAAESDINALKSVFY